MAKGTPNAGINGTLANGLLAHYCFNDGSLADLSGNGNDLSGIFAGTADKNGKANQALYFKNKKDIVKNGFTYPSGDILNISFWFVAIDINSIQTLFCLGDLDTGQAINIYQGKMQNANTYGVLSDVSIKEQEWINICVKINKQTNIISWYKNGVYIGQNATASFSSWGNNLYLGWSGSLYYPYTCQVVGIDEVRFYGRDLEDSEIAEIFTMGANYQGDITPPTFNTINTSNVTSSSIDLNIKCNENATAYHKLYDRGVTAPTNTELQTTHDGTMALTANNLVTKNIVGLTALKDYDLYVVAEDTVGNLQANVSLLQFNANNGNTATPISDKPSGGYLGSQTISLSCATPFSTIYYTLDGSNPTNLSTEYVSPIEISETSTLKTVAYTDGYLKSNINIFNYVITSSISNTNYYIENIENTKIFLDRYYDTNIKINSSNNQNGILNKDEYSNILNNSYIDSVELKSCTLATNNAGGGLLLYDNQNQFCIINGIFDIRFDTANLYNRMFFYKNQTINYKKGAYSKTLSFDGAVLNATSISLSTNTIFKIYLNGIETVAYEINGNNITFAKNYKFFGNYVTIIYYKTSQTDVIDYNLIYSAPYERFSNIEEIKNGFIYGVTLSTIDVAVNGSGFLNLKAGMYIKINNESRKILQIINDTNLVVDKPFSTNYVDEIAYITTFIEIVNINDDFSDSTNLTFVEQTQRKDKIYNKVVTNKNSSLSFTYFYSENLDESNYTTPIHYGNWVDIDNFRLIRIKNNTVEIYTNCRKYEISGKNESSDKNTKTVNIQYENKLTVDYNKTVKEVE